MSAARRRKLMLITFILFILSLVSALVLYALRQNISLFYTPTQVAVGDAPVKRSIRVGGMVEKGSIIRSTEGLSVQFKVTDYSNTLTIRYTGILPDLFREEQGIVAEGELSNKQVFYATRVLAKHDANYMPPEVKAALAGKNPASAKPKDNKDQLGRTTGDTRQPGHSRIAWFKQFASVPFARELS